VAADWLATDVVLSGSVAAVDKCASLRRFDESVAHAVERTPGCTLGSVRDRYRSSSEAEDYFFVSGSRSSRYEAEWQFSAPLRDSKRKARRAFAVTSTPGRFSNFLTARANAFGLRHMSGSVGAGRAAEVFVVAVVAGRGVRAAG
jgi:hypothetical protein